MQQHIAKVKMYVAEAGEDLEWSFDVRGFLVCKATLEVAVPLAEAGSMLGIVLFKSIIEWNLEEPDLTKPTICFGWKWPFLWRGHRGKPVELTREIFDDMPIILLVNMFNHMSMHCSAHGYSIKKVQNAG